MIIQKICFIPAEVNPSRNVKDKNKLHERIENVQLIELLKF